MKTDEDLLAMTDGKTDDEARLAIIQSHHYMDQTIDAKFSMLERLRQE